MRCKLMLIALVFFAKLNANAQGDSLYVEKKKCEGNYKGYKLVLHYKSKDSQQSSFAYGYDLDYFIDLDDNKKLLLIEALLKFENDTSNCCMSVTGYSLNGNEGCITPPKSITKLPIQVDALFMINRLCWSKLTELYCCSPVLYDTKLKKEINGDLKKIMIVFDEYKKWYDNCKAKGRINKYFPFNDGRYVWYGGRKSIHPTN